MFQIRHDDFFDKLEKKYDFLWVYPLGDSYTSYILRDNVQVQNNQVCNVLSNGNPNSKCDLSNLCRNVASFLSKLKDEFNNKIISSFSKECEFLNYWIYFMIKNHLQCDNIKLLYEQLNTLKSQYIPTDHSCNIQSFEIDEKIFFTKKTLFFHAEILYWIKHGYKGVNKSEKDLYNKFLKDCFDIYKENICSTTEKKQSYNDELTKFKTNFNDAINFLKGEGVSISQEEIPSDNNLICQHESAPNKAVVEAVASRDTGMVVTDINEDAPNPDTPSKVGTVGATLAGSSIFLLMMYKYTPLGTWVSTKILGRNKLMENMKKNNYELLLNDVGNHEASLNDPMYHIRYNSATNH
ncbi:PIR protein [Plasmodium vivax]|nr:PIR protein [Plasmodium vivax]